MMASPYKFEAAWSAWEFAYHILHRQANIAIISMAWLTRENARSYSRTPKEPDMDTLAYWVARLEPLIRCEDEGEIIVVLANRTGVEGDAVYAGTSAVLGIQSGEVKLYGVLGRGERELLVVDTSNKPQAKLVNDPSSTSSAETTDSAKSANSAESRESHGSESTQSSLASLMEPDEFQPSIDEVLAGILPVSPVEPLSPHAFFASSPMKAEDRQTLKSTITQMTDEAQTLKSSKESTYQTLKSATNGINRKDSSTPAADAGVFERPSSPKSRNASRTRQPVQQEQALHTHDLAGVEPETRRAPSRNGMGSRNMARAATPRPVAQSAMGMADAVPGGEWEFVEWLCPPGGGGTTSVRPKSTGW
jgi:hypothetical protein